MNIIVENDWMDELIGGSSLQNLDNHPYHKAGLLTVSVLGSILGVAGVYLTRSALSYVFSIIGVTCWNSMLFLTLFGVKPKTVEEQPMNPEQKLAYNRKLGELKAEQDFKQRMNNGVPRRL